jgi:hypothetical protein
MLPDTNGQFNLSPEMEHYARLMQGYKLRIVASINRLIEKILIFDHGLDDRAIELLKRYLYSAHFEAQGISRHDIYFSGAEPNAEQSELEFALIDSYGSQRCFRVSGKSGYPRALVMLHREFKVPEAETTRWRVVDCNYWDLAEQGKG